MKCPVCGHDVLFANDVKDFVVLACQNEKCAVKTITLWLDVQLLDSDWNKRLAALDDVVRMNWREMFGE